MNIKVIVVSGEITIAHEEFTINEGDYSTISQAVAYTLGGIDPVFVWGEGITQFQVQIAKEDLVVHDTGLIETPQDWDEKMSHIVTALDVVARAKKFLGNPIS